MKFEMSKANYRIEGEGLPVLLIGGQFMAISAWGGIVSDLCRFYRIITLEYPNQGISPSDHSIDDLKTYSLFTIDFMREAGLEPSETVVFGLSFGATIVKSMAFDFGVRFRAAVLAAIGPNSLQSYVAEIYQLWIDLIRKGDLGVASKVIFSKLLSPGFISRNPGLLEFASSDLVRKYEGRTGSLLSLLNSTRNYLLRNSGTEDRRFPFETHLIGADSDPMIPAIYVEEYARILGCPFLGIPGGHIITMEQPSELLRILHEILGSHDVP